MELLSNLRKLQPVISKTVTDMSIHFDLSEDTRYLQGIEKGEARGEARGEVMSAKIIKHYLKGETIATIAHALAIETTKVAAVIANFEAE